MRKNSQYKEDIRFIQRVENLMSKKLEVIIYYIGLLACLLVHILYLTLFAFNGVKEMAVFNIFSVTFYALMVFLVTRTKEKELIVYSALVEIIIHASVATVYVGWEPDFGMFLLMIIPVVFLIPNRKKTIAFVTMFISLILYGILRYAYVDPEKIVYDIDDKAVSDIFYFLNIGVGTSVLVFLTVVYSIRNRYIDSVLRTQNEQLRIIASVDPLTQLSNRRAMGEDLKNVCTESKATGKSYVVGLGDIDNFKKVNDTYGHDFGDSVLSTVAEIIMDNIPENGYAARWGGEEFLFVIPQSDVNEGFRYAEKIVNSISQYKFTKDDMVFSVTMTFGVCEGMPGDDVDKIISCADRRLYKGKNNGKNHTEYTD